MLSGLILSAALWPATVTHECNPTNQDIIVGVARDTNNQMLYCEMVRKPAENQLDIRYTRDQKIFATKYLNFAGNPLMPEVLQQDQRSGELRQTINHADDVVLIYRANKNKKLQKITIEKHKIDMVDAGFDNFIRAHWNELTSGKLLSVDFASMAHQKLLPLRISQQPLSKCLDKHEIAESRQCFVVDIDNALLRLVLGNIKLVYDEKQRLIKFNGVVNINDEKESPQTATIYYFYAEDYFAKQP